MSRAADYKTQCKTLRETVALAQEEHAAAVRRAPSFEIPFTAASEPVASFAVTETGECAGAACRLTAEQALSLAAWLVETFGE